MRTKNNLRRALSETLDLPEEVILDVPNIRINGDTDVFIENHKGIIEYSQEMLRLSSVLGIIRINGNDIKIKEINQESILITGSIISIEIIK